MECLIPTIFIIFDIIAIVDATRSSLSMEKKLLWVALILWSRLWAWPFIFCWAGLNDKQFKGNGTSLESRRGIFNEERNFYHYMRGIVPDHDDHRCF